MLNELIKRLAECYKNNDFSDVVNYLDDNCIYSSQWVLDELCGKGAISQFLIEKSKTVASNLPDVKTVQLTAPIEKPAILLSQSGMDVIVLVSEKNGKIISIELCMPTIFEY